MYCNNKFSYTAEATLKLVQQLYEKKVVTYPRVDTTFLPNDMYPKVSTILQGLASYANLTKPLLGNKIRKSTKVFNDSKVTDHHAIIPTGEQLPLGKEEQNVYDIITRRFIAVFYPDCKVAKTQVKAEVNTVDFVAKGKEILEPGWRAVFANPNASDEKTTDETTILPTFKKGEEGEHIPSFIEKTTKAPNNYSEATLLRAMETAGKQVDDEELSDLMKKNGIGRPSTRANIIETLFKRKYTVRNKKHVLPTEMGIQLINTIQNKLLKSAELTGQWEKQLKEIEQGTYSAKQFIANMKKMVDDLVMEVQLEQGRQRVVTEAKADKTSSKKTGGATVSLACPKCEKGVVIKGKNLFGCNQWKEGCDFRIPFSFMDKKLTNKQIERLITKKATTKIKGFNFNGEKTDGVLRLTADFNVDFTPAKSKEKKAPSDSLTCPKCKKGSIIKGKTAYGCSDWKAGCDFKFSFADIKAKANGKALSKELVLEIISQ